MSYKEPYTELLRINFLKYMRKAFQFLPEMKNPKILDLGCGSGLISLELAKLTDGIIHAIDIDPTLLDKLNEKVKKRNLLQKFRIQRINFLKNNFPNDYFDLIWEEGVVHIIGFKKSFKECNRILKRGGFLVLGQSIKLMEKNEALINECGYELIKQLNWSKGCWWNEFYGPLEIMIKEIHEGKKPNIFENISIIEDEISWVKNHPDDSDCAHYILRKKIIERGK